MSLLPPGSFDVTVEAAGLGTAKQTVVVRMGASVSASFTLRVAGVAENVQVGGPTLEPAATQAKAVLTDLQLQNLPASGRRVRSLFLFTPATQIELECEGFRDLGTKKGVCTSINVDGGDYTNTHWCGHVEFSPTFSIEALQEFGDSRHVFRRVRLFDRRHHQHRRNPGPTSCASGFYLFRQ